MHIYNSLKLVILVLFIATVAFFAGCTTPPITPEVICPEEEVEEEVTLDSFRVAFEDVEWAIWSGGDCLGGNDYDYDDCVCDVDVDGKFICGDHLKEVKLQLHTKTTVLVI